jgi:hypothetical protein
LWKVCKSRSRSTVDLISTWDGHRRPLSSIMFQMG